MKIIHDVQQLKTEIRQAKQAGQQVGLIPTMGNLHQGHLTLVEEAKKHTQFTVASIFVNPTQFGPNEDFDNYPRTLDEDAKKLELVGLDILFAPDVATMYPNGTDMKAKVEVPRLSEILCGASRPGHFTGVATVVSKLFNLTEPDKAFFGEKDFQQLTVIKRFTEELVFPIEVLGVPTVREDNGLAMSSRNGYLTAQEKENAAAIYRSMCEIKQQLESGQVTWNDQTRQTLCENAQQTLEQMGFIRDYYEIRRRSDLEVPAPTDKQLVILVAAKLGKARLIDNMQIDLP